MKLSPKAEDGLRLPIPTPVAGEFVFRVKRLAASGSYRTLAPPLRSLRGRMLQCNKWRRKSAE
jgi:hypothetical protein